MRTVILFLGAAILVGGAVGLFSINRKAQTDLVTGSAKSCRKMDIDEATGRVRDKGLVPCDDLASENSRGQLIRDGFVHH
jgi:hypothetical protein